MLIVYEGGVAVFGCSPFYPLNPPILVTAGFSILSPESEPRLEQEDFVVDDSPSTSNRTYYFKDVVWSDNDTSLICVVGDELSNEVKLNVYG